MAKTALVNLMVEIPEEEQYPETYIMQKLRDSLCVHNDKDSFFNEFQVDVTYVPSNIPEVLQKK